MSISKLAKIAKKTLSTGTYTSINDVILRYPNGVEVNGITVKSGLNQNNAIALTYNDYGDNDNGDNDNGDNDNYDVDVDNLPFFFAESGDLKKLVKAWLAEMTIEEIDAELSENPITLRIYKITTKNGRDYVKAHIVENSNSSAYDNVTLDDLHKALKGIDSDIASKQAEIDSYTQQGQSAVAAKLKTELDTLLAKKEKLQAIIFEATNKNAQ